MPFMYCDPPTTIAHIRPATGNYHAAAGKITLSSGASFEIGPPNGDPQPPEHSFLIKLRKTDHIQLCFAPVQQWADEPAGSRMAIVGDVETRAYFYGAAHPK